MKIAVVGVGYLGAVHAAAMASLGFDVVGVDVDEVKVEALRLARAPFYEPGFDALLEEQMQAGRLSWTQDYSETADCDLHFICVGTPQQAGSHNADLTFVRAAIRELVTWLKPGAVIVGKSTVPVGTGREIEAVMRESWAKPGERPVVVWNPEFLREGCAVNDTLRPDRIVIGAPTGDSGQRAVRAVEEAYASIIASGTPLMITDLETAELVKVAANAFLATKISFINAMAEVCEATGADVLTLADAIGYDARIGRKFLGAGVGFGGGCLPKDIRAFSARAGELGVDQALTFLREVDSINARRRDRAVLTTQQLLRGNLRGQRVCVLGAAFKPNSDDVRDSPALDIAARLHTSGADVVVHDPKALVNAALRFPALDYEANLDDAMVAADVVLVLTEWDQYREIDPTVASQLVAHPRILDGRNCLDSIAWRAAGWEFRGMGREHNSIPGAERVSR